MMNQTNKNIIKLNLFKKFIDKSKFGVCVLDLDGTICYINKTFPDFFKLNYDELIGKNIYDFLIIDDEQDINNKLETLLCQQNKWKCGTNENINIENICEKIFMYTNPTILIINQINKHLQSIINYSELITILNHLSDENKTNIKK